MKNKAITLSASILFIIIASAFFYLLTAGTMPKYVDIMTADEIACANLYK